MECINILDVQCPPNVLWVHIVHRITTRLCLPVYCFKIILHQRIFKFSLMAKMFPNVYKIHNYSIYVRMYMHIRNIMRYFELSILTFMSLQLDTYIRSVHLVYHILFYRLHRLSSSIRKSSCTDQSFLQSAVEACADFC